MNYDELTRAQIKQVIEQTGYSKEDLKTEQPYFVPRHEWESYAQQEAEELGLIADNGMWPTNHIDWGAAADELEMDYTSVELDGKEYLFRSW